MTAQYTYEQTFSRALKYCELLHQVCMTDNVNEVFAPPTSPHRRAMIKINDYGWKVRIKRD